VTKGSLPYFRTSDSRNHPAAIPENSLQKAAFDPKNLYFYEEVHFKDPSNFATTLLAFQVLDLITSPPIVIGLESYFNSRE